MAAVTAIVAGAFGSSAPDHMSYRWGDFYSHNSESFETETTLEETLPKSSPGVPNIGVIVRGSPQHSGARVGEELKHNPRIAKVAKTVVASDDGRFSYVVAWLKHEGRQGSAASIVAQELTRPGVVVGGPLLAVHEFTEQTAADLQRAQFIAFPLLLLLGLWVFRGVVASVLPVMLGGFALLLALGIFRLTTEFLPLSVFSLDIALALALGLGVDYSLLMVSRFREGLSTGLDPQPATEKTLRTAGTTVAFSSAAIAASFCSLLIVPVPFVRSIAFAGAVVAIVTGLTALVLMPMLLLVLGHRVNGLAPRIWRRSPARPSHRREGGAWYRIARFATQRPISVALLSGLTLVALALPALSIRSTGFDQTSLPSSSEARQFAEKARQEFQNPLVGEIAIAIHGNQETANAIWRRVRRIGERTGLGTTLSAGVEHAADLWQIRINPTTPVFSKGAESLVSQLREMNAPMSVGGETAASMDSASVLKQSMPYVAVVVALSSLLFIYVATGSLVLSIKALVMSVLSLGAALGVVVFIFQYGRLEDALDYTSQGALVVALPLVMAAAAFGLLTDYGLFLLMRIKEERERGISDREAVALGLERSGPVITAAALLFCVAVGAFSTSGLLLLKVAAISIVLTVAFDAFLVRPMLVPSLMAILGKWNWWPREMPLKSEGHLRESGKDAPVGLAAAPVQDGSEGDD